MGSEQSSNSESSSNDYSSYNDTSKSYTDRAVTTTADYGAYIGGSSFSTGVVVHEIASNLVQQEYNSGVEYVNNYEAAKDSGMSDRDASNYATANDLNDH